jgi:hypothetical protein
VILEKPFRSSDRGAALSQSHSNVLGWVVCGEESGREYGTLRKRKGNFKQRVQIFVCESPLLKSLLPTSFDY